MKRITAFILLTAVLLGLAACGGNPTTAVPATTIPPQTTQAKPSQTTPTTTPHTHPHQPTQRNIRLTFDENYEGGAVETVTVNGDGVYEALHAPVRKGYVFLGWFTEPEGGQQAQIGEVLLSDQDHTLYAHWEVKTRFTIALDANGGRVSPYQNQLVLKNGEQYGTLPEPVREGYKFLGWYTEAENGQWIKSTTKFTADQDQVLYAHWQYDAAAYWSFILENRVQQIPQCRRVVVYVERTANYKTYISSDFLDDVGAINPGVNLESTKVNDDWIDSVNPHIIIKLAKEVDTATAVIAKTAMMRRFPDADIYVFPTAAISGTQKYQIYCRLYLAKLLYPEYFEDVDLETVKNELNAKITIFH